MSEAQFIRLNNNIIQLKKVTEISSLSSLGLYGVISAFLSNPEFKTSFGGFKEAVLKHCSNGRYSFCSCWNGLKNTGYLKRTRIPSGIHEFHDYYTLLNTPDKQIPNVVNLKITEKKEFLSNKRPFSAPTNDYTEISYKMLMDSNISLCAKGLYAAIKRFINLYNNSVDVVLSKEYIRKSVKMGFRSFNTAWRELKKYGYLKTERIWDYNKNCIRYIYILENISSAKPSEAEIKKKDKVVPSLKNDREIPIISAADKNDLQELIDKVKYNIEYDVLEEKPIVKEYLNSFMDIITSTLKLDDSCNINFKDGSLSVKEAKNKILEMNHEEAEFACLSYHEKLLEKNKIKSKRKYFRSIILNAKNDYTDDLQSINAQFLKDTYNPHLKKAYN